MLIRQREQEPWYLKLNPNGRIPVLVDRSRNDFVIFETSAILLYLAQHYDKDNKFGFHPINDADEYSVVLQWLFFSVGAFRYSYHPYIDLFPARWFGSYARTR